MNFRRSVIIAPEIVRQIFKRFFLRFFRITTNYSKVFKILFRKFSSRHWPIDVLCSNLVKFGRREIGEIVCCLSDKIFCLVSRCRYCSDRAQNLSGPALENILRVLQISSESVYFRRSYISERVNNAKTRRKVNPIFGWSLASSQIKTLKTYSGLTSVLYINLYIIISSLVCRAHLYIKLPRLSVCVCVCLPDFSKKCGPIFMKLFMVHRVHT